MVTAVKRLAPCLALVAAGCSSAEPVYDGDLADAYSARQVSDLTVGGYYCPTRGEIAGRDVPASGLYYLTTFGGGSDTQRMACGGTADARWLYIADSWRFGCGARVRVTNPRTGRWCVTQVADIGPNICVERAAGRPVIDASPLLARELFGMSAYGWRERVEVRAEAVDRATALGCGSGAVADAGVSPPRDAGPPAPVDAGPPAPVDAGPPALARPAAGASWHIDLEAPVDTAIAADWYDIDLFDNGASTIRAIHDRGARVACYFSAGSSEDWRPDFGDFPSAGLGRALDGWAGERWLDVRHAGVRAVMRARLDLARSKGCDGVDPDNVDGYANDNGLGLSAANQLDYNRWLAAEAHARGMVVGLKNDVEQIPSLLAHFDFAINEQCFAYDECDAVAAFTRAGRSVLNIEYGSVAANARAVCPRASALGFFTILSAMDRLDGSYTRCPR